MRILWISQNLPFPPKTGVLQRNYNLIREASKFATVDLVGIVKRDVLPGYDADSATRELGRLCASVQGVDLPVENSRSRFLWTVARSTVTPAPFTVNWASSPVLRKVLQRLSAAAHDLVYFDTISLAGYRGLFPRSARVLNHHNIESQLFDRRIAYERNRARRLYYRMEARKLRRYEAEVAGEFDANLVVSDLDGGRLREICPAASTSVVANGVDIDYFRGGRVDAEPRHLVMVSGMNWFPNRDAVLFMAERIWPILAASQADVRLTIVGADPPLLVQQLAAKDSRIRVTGFVEDVRPYMERAQVYLCPMRDGGGTRLKILDALSMGTPIVATALALEGIQVEHEREVLVAQTPQQFVEQIRRLTEDDGLRHRLSTNGRSFVERHFSWPVIGRRMEETFAGLVRWRSGHA